MAWFTRLTRFGDAHLVYGQEANMSCGIASVMMCVFKVNKLKPGAASVTVEKDIYQKYSQALGSAYTPEFNGYLSAASGHSAEQFHDWDLELAQLRTERRVSEADRQSGRV